MKNLMKIIGVVILASVVLISCKKDEVIEDKTPEITSVTAENHDGGKQIPLGGTISVDFDAKSRSGEKLNYYNIEIHDHPASGAVADEYKIIDDQFTNNFEGLNNAHVHQHIAVPDTANPGSYHVVIIVVDEDGNSSDTETLETHIEIVQQ
jgi:hypothetical protein